MKRVPGKNARLGGVLVSVVLVVLTVLAPVVLVVLRPVVLLLESYRTT